jgi:hypothetical protein
MSLASLYFRGGDFLLIWKGHFSFWCSAQKFLGRCRDEENSVTAQRPLRDTAKCSVSPLPLFRTALTLTAFSILVLFARDFFFGMVRWGSGGFPLRRKLTEFNAVIESSAHFLPFCGNGSFGRK